MEEDSDTQQGTSILPVCFNDIPEEYADDPNYAATQLVTDPRRLGEQHSGLSDEELTDVYCILHPASLFAYKETALMAERTPQHTIGASRMSLQVHDGRQEDQPQSPGALDLASQGIVGCDIALRLSAELKNPLAGFVFGRDKRRCDLVLGETESVRRISNVHFRIYYDENGTLMLEDQSTNGTLIEGHLLRGAEKFRAKGHKNRHTLENGTVISFPSNRCDEELKFIVRIPQRDEKYEDLYRMNLVSYFDRRSALRQQKIDAKAAALVQGNAIRIGEAPDIFANRHAVTQTPNQSSRSRYTREWRGGSKYNKVRIIGKGAFASVYMITTKFDGTPFAAKELEKRRFMKNGILDQKVENEMNIMSLIHHPNIVQYIEHVDWDEYLYLILEYVPNGDLGSLVSERGTLPEARGKLMASQLLSALKYLHRLGITHRDVKPDNILIHSNDPFHVKLTDFGLSKMIENDDTNLRTFCGTLLYCAPEVYSEYREYDLGGKRTNRGKHTLPPQRYDQAVDLWSLAGVIFYAMSGRPPFPASNGTSYQELLDKIMTQPLDVRPLQRSHISDDGIDFVRSMLHIRPECRPSIQELENNPWIKSNTEVTSLDDYDEVDMVGQDNGNNLEQSASQLSIKEKTSSEAVESLDDLEVIELLEVNREREISSNAVSGDNTSDESYAFMRNASEKPRLFGEIADVSAIGSSGVFPNNLLNLPTSQYVNYNDQSHNNGAIDSQKGRSPTVLLKADGTYDHIPAVTPTTIDRPSQGVEGKPVIGGTASSLLGAESLVGQMQMNSQYPAQSHDGNETQPGQGEAYHIRHKGISNEQGLPTGPQSHYLTKSRRRSHDETADADATIPNIDQFTVASKRLKGQNGDAVSITSNRDIRDESIGASVFWNPRDKSTHHYNYPRLSINEYEELLAKARLRGENLYPGEKSFEEMLGPYRLSRSPSLEPEGWFISQSEQQASRPRMLRDERRMSDMLGKEGGPPFVGPRGDLSTDLNALGAKNEATLKVPSNSPSFRAPLPILAKLSSTADSAVQSPTLNIVEPIISWGRGQQNTNVYADKADVKVPKYAFKLVLWNPHMDTSRSYKEQLDLNFWMSTKATNGISINNVHLPSHEPASHDRESLHWAQLRHGDLITIWRNDKKPDDLVQFRFECKYSSSQIIRAYGPNHLKVLAPGPEQQRLDAFCLQLEKQNWAAKKAEREAGKENASSRKRDELEI
ncbi:MAG: hypothetical protein M1818_008259 [Claussenomyces sp. TS43310]|nr:MAG: hypothetical protein M1818_008259 [Claussenomyces sp. TS43310]